MTQPINPEQEQTVEYVDVPVPAADLAEVAKKLLKAAGEEHQLVRTVSGGFRVPFALAKEARVLSLVARTVEDADGEPAADEPVKPAAKKGTQAPPAPPAE